MVIKRISNVDVFFEKDKNIVKLLLKTSLTIRCLYLYAIIYDN